MITIILIKNDNSKYELDFNNYLDLSYFLKENSEVEYFITELGDKISVKKFLEKNEKFLRK
jgi:hypothetical protein